MTLKALFLPETHIPHSEHSPALTPWIVTPYRLVSWWDMEKFSAGTFYILARIIEQIADHGRTHPPDEIIPTDRAEYDSENLLEVAADCSAIGLRLSAICANELAEKLKEEITFGERSSILDILQGRIKDEMNTQLFLYIPTERVWSYDQKELFGQGVNNKFPEAQFDITEAGNCYTAGRGTAAVFHLMRVMELAVQKLGDKLGVTLVQEKNWQVILDGVDKAIKALPKSPTKVAMSQATASLYAVKVAWRNEVMHPKETYTLEEAENLIRLVKMFMQQLAEIV
jgi:hypothetical protein